MPDDEPKPTPAVPSYFSHPDLLESELRVFFEVASSLWSAAPWALVGEAALLQVEIPDIELKEGCVSIMGSLGEVKGLALYRSVLDFRREVAAASDEDDAALTHDALYLLFQTAENVPASMRDEVAAHGWPRAEPTLYPMLGRLAGGKPGTITATDLRVMVMVARALDGFVRLKPEAFGPENKHGLRAVMGDGSSPDVIVTTPHPDLAHEAWLASRASTIEGVANPYGLPLSPEELRELSMGLLGFSLHRVLGLFCAVASVPELVEGAQWMALIVPGMDVSDEQRVKRLFGLLVRVYNHVIASMADDAEPSLVPTASALEPCAEWALGFKLICQSPGRYKLDGDATQALFEIFAVAGDPQVLEILADKGEAKLQARLSECRQMLVDNLVKLYDFWEPTRRNSARLLVPRGAPEPTSPAAKPGRNDACPCGSGKKHKKCCGR